VFWHFMPCALSHSVVQYLPLIIYLAADPAPGRRTTWLLGGLVLLQSLSNPYLTVTVFVPLGLLAAARVLRPASRQAGGRLAAVLAAALAVLVVLHAGYFVVRAENPDLVHQTHWSIALVAQRTRLPWGPFGAGHALALPRAAFVLIALGALGALARRRVLRAAPAPPDRAWPGWVHATLWTVVGLLMSFTPGVFWYETPIRLPHALLDDWTPLYDLIRVPKRLGIAALLGASMLAGLAFAECARRVAALVPRPWLARAGALALAAAVVIASWAGAAPRVRLGAGLAPRPYPIQEAIDGDGPLMARLRAPGGPLLELPVDARGAIGHARAMYRSIFHRRRLLNGYHGYWPEAFPARMALAARLPDRRALEALRLETGLAVVLVHVDQCKEPARSAWQRLIVRGQGTGLRLVARDGDDALFEVMGP
jgi:hypothetical protein